VIHPTFQIRPRMLGNSCGLWPTSRGLVASLVDADGVLAYAGAIPADSEDDFLDWLAGIQRYHGPITHLVLTESLARDSFLAAHAIQYGHRLWIAPLGLVTSISRAAWWRPTPRGIAAMLARLPLVAALRAFLRLAPTTPSPDQLDLFFDLPRLHAIRRARHPQSVVPKLTLKQESMP
jgi:hypothetical protein